MIEKKVVINTAVVPFSHSKCEDGRVIDSWLGQAVGLVETVDFNAEVTSGVLWLHRAIDGDAVAHAYHLPSLAVSKRRPRDDSYIRLMQNVCKQERKQESAGTIITLKAGINSGSIAVLI